MHSELPNITNEQEMMTAIITGDKMTRKFALIINSVHLSPNELSPETVDHIMNGQRAGLDSEDIDKAILIGKTLQSEPKD